MTADRRSLIEQALSQSQEPLSATSLARQHGVSRQVIVGDIALLRAAGHQIQATPRGYVLVRPASSGFVGTIACRHGLARMQEELYTVVDLGGTVLDVIVEHAVYGQLVGQLQVASRFDADEFLTKITEENAQLLSTVTDGVHLHTVLCKDAEAFDRIKAALDDRGLLYQTNP
ncbi:MAG: transcription repressor NadR [Eubacteriales bacterium]|jgi:transcriptional regulator of NAD metabolism|nr:transcription repressor NadR [Eubacteriales bacterium]MDD4138990.1 transcription repressor NadR [Eubacteriales bacterium]MDD4743790.1 transcription repressor NadR [Eubacteriales bacterium]NLO34834.1 transcription repressor NadR [Clostridiaceae bacterium]